MAVENGIVFLDDSEAASSACREIIYSLPDWFGIAASNEKYIDEIAGKDVFAAMEGMEPVGLIAMKYHFNRTAEIWWMGMKPEYHGKGLGTGLFMKARDRAVEKGCGYMAVSTLSSRSTDDFYRKTRSFYEKLGFKEFVEYYEDDPLNPMVWMTLPLFL